MSFHVTLPVFFPPQPKRYQTRLSPPRKRKMSVAWTRSDKRDPVMSARGKPSVLPARLHDAEAAF